MAALINAVVDDRDLQERIVAGQDAALDRLEARDFAGTLLAFVDQLLATPRRPHPPVAFDFWDQIQVAEELEAIKAYPAVGLPGAAGRTMNLATLGLR